MVKINKNYLKLQDSYLFSTVAKKVSEFSEKNPDKKASNSASCCRKYEKGY